MGKMVVSHEKNIHKEATNANWIKVSVAGLGKALRMAFEEVLVKIEAMYHTAHNVYVPLAFYRQLQPIFIYIR